MIQTPQNKAVELSLSDLRQEMAEEIAWLKSVISCQKLEIIKLTTQRDNAEFLLQQERRKNT